ncbi:hypothetical protein IW261DRAFT_1632998 [Armillaria novae-zelandiae]|uniref:Uncharacterized protein n=1 Tax=Armillaria novae-zelandiae TaxID=153914 RepID=A0AA39P5B1_9AGAR|nr:hypothetical protein IW261DRAFT_1632998 [Armillaria novae-zelandiae]
MPLSSTSTTLQATRQMDGLEHPAFSLMLVPLVLTQGNHLLKPRRDSRGVPDVNGRTVTVNSQVPLMYAAPYGEFGSVLLGKYVEGRKGVENPSSFVSEPESQIASLVDNGASRFNMRTRMSTDKAELFTYTCQDRAGVREVGKSNSLTEWTISGDQYVRGEIGSVAGQAAHVKRRFECSLKTPWRHLHWRGDRQRCQGWEDAAVQRLQSRSLVVVEREPVVDEGKRTLQTIVQCLETSILVMLTKRARRIGTVDVVTRKDRAVEFDVDNAFRVSTDARSTGIDTAGRWQVVIAFYADSRVQTNGTQPDGRRQRIVVYWRHRAPNQSPDTDVHVMVDSGLGVETWQDLCPKRRVDEWILMGQRYTYLSGLENRIEGCISADCVARNAGWIARDAMENWMFDSRRRLFDDLRIIAVLVQAICVIERERLVGGHVPVATSKDRSAGGTRGRARGWTVRRCWDSGTKEWSARMDSDGRDVEGRRSCGCGSSTADGRVAVREGTAVFTQASSDGGSGRDSGDGGNSDFDKGNGAVAISLFQCCQSPATSSRIVASRLERTSQGPDMPASACGDFGSMVEVISGSGSRMATQAATQSTFTKIEGQQSTSWRVWTS